eukprot:TRINITY_DN29622_c0_g1_i1.p1 TRINITY_DN29622_c0_g1~~TRINITY_DN29622_c0_g1_i1.p1  ORF type:complete len:222 (+),score=92.81 TRINITY_DN29622_c0_g1_i1:176-841(+)
MSGTPTSPMDVDAMATDSDDLDDSIDLPPAQAPAEDPPAEEEETLKEEEMEEAMEEEPAPAEAESTPEEIAAAILQEALSLKALGNKLYSGSKYDSAIDHYSQAIDMKPEDPELNLSLLGNRAACYMMIDKFSAAIADCEAALQINPKYVKGYLRAGKCYLRVGDFEQSKKMFNQAKVWEPANVQVKTELATVSNTEDFYKRATEFPVSYTHLTLPTIYSV